ncbi:hypothetical protein OGAPHI_002462 [Ogataea philodendri]|uniref:Uncharacterized protein n=1 Tax=Ogataea philodendri TaxID=1378263 RepID=A0A9P8PAJ8_9ASCO|nr:uncharacterized protein OGAPHI_002462 [Ogataea philodendri]KAH3668708.1 hypothetical protein OGAPHI_002462 [Ogataea philodendri]
MWLVRALNVRSAKEPLNRAASRNITRLDKMTSKVIIWGRYPMITVNGMNESRPVKMILRYSANVKDPTSMEKISL